MAHLNVEIKARCRRPDEVRKLLCDRGADFRGVDHQIDTYFRCPGGRLKFRDGTIERALIYYRRENRPGPKTSRVCLYSPGPGETLKDLLAEAMGVLVVVDKRREIYFLGNVKFHIDRVEALGEFVEIEAIDSAGDIDPRKLRDQCESCMRLLGIDPGDLVTGSYSDMLLARGEP